MVRDYLTRFDRDLTVTEHICRDQPLIPQDEHECRDGSLQFGTRTV